MKKFLSSLAAIIVLAAVVGFIYTEYVAKKTAPQPSTSQNTKAQPSLQPSVVIKTIHEDSASIKYKVNASYPQINGLSNLQTQTNINNAITALVQEDVANFKKEVNTTEQNPNLPSSFQNFINEFTITPTVARADNKIVSVQFSVLDSQAGMAHPNNYNQVFNYDVAHNKKLALSDIFKQNSNYLTVLSNLAQKDLQKQMASNPNATDMIKTGASPDAKNFQLFVLKSDSLVLIFDPAQVAASFEGTRTVTIPYTDLQTVLNPTIMTK